MNIKFVNHLEVQFTHLIINYWLKVNFTILRSLNKRKIREDDIPKVLYWSHILTKESTFISKSHVSVSIRQ